MGRTMGSGKHPRRYINPITGVISPTSFYINEQGIKKPISPKYIEFKVGDKWLKPHLVPFVRESKKKYLNTKKGFFLKVLGHLDDVVRRKEKKGRHIQGKHEFKDNRWGRCDKLMAHFDKQVEQYGYKCPITHIPFTIDTPLERFDINNYHNKTFSNVSPDRIFNYINYTEQNLIFTSQLWNFTKGESSLYELGLIFKPEIVERYKAIVIERFPDQKYALQT